MSSPNHIAHCKIEKHEHCTLQNLTMSSPMHFAHCKIEKACSEAAAEVEDMHIAKLNHVFSDADDPEGIVWRPLEQQDTSMNNKKKPRLTRRPRGQTTRWWGPYRFIKVYSSAASDVVVGWEASCIRASHADRTFSKLFNNNMSELFVFRF